jgi:hypothetical protein
MEAPDVIKVFFFLLRIVPVILLVILLVAFFNNLNTEFQIKEMERTGLKIADNLAGSQLTKSRNIFLQDKLAEIDGQNIEPVQSCEFAYYAKLGTNEKMDCSENENCGAFCIEVCGIKTSEIIYGTYGNCRCVYECSCKKDGIWKEKYEWGFGYMAATPYAKYEWKMPSSLYIKNSQTGGKYYDTAKPALFEVTVYDSALARISCAIKKAYVTRKTQKLVIGCIQPVKYNIIEANTKNEECHLCLINTKINNLNQVCMCYRDENDELKTEECRYMPGIRFKSFETSYNPQKDKILAVNPVFDNNNDISGVEFSFEKGA